MRTHPEEVPMKKFLRALGAPFRLIGKVRYDSDPYGDAEARRKQQKPEDAARHGSISGAHWL